MWCVVVRIFVRHTECYENTMVYSSRDFQFYAHWCARLADQCKDPAIATDLRTISRELIMKAQDEARLKNNAA